MQPRNAYWLLAALFLAQWLVLSGPRIEAQRAPTPVISAPHGAAWRVPCDSVMSEVHKAVRTAKETHVDISRVAVHLNTSIAWAEHCMQVYGLRTKRPGIESAEGREEEMESFEEDEPEEVAPEDTEEEGAPNPKVYPERQKLLRVHPPPTPREGTESNEGYREGYENR